MKHPVLMVRLWAALLFLLAAATPAAAQRDGRDDGEYQILHARYGTRNHHVDVTPHLKELARKDRRFKLGNSTFGIDPDKGQRKTLRIYTRGPNGAHRMFEYMEGRFVDGSIFTGWGRGDWGRGEWKGGWDGDSNRDDGEYQILHARYGTRNHHVDVTPHLKELARKDLRFKLGNSTFGIDPDKGQRKALRIYTRGPNGAHRMFEYVEGRFVDGSIFTGWGRGDWGRGEWKGGWDGAPLDTPNYDDGAFQILHARYGTRSHNVDVTPRLKELARRDVRFRLENSTLGVDPDKGQHKTLRIYARGPRGEHRTFEYSEKSFVDGTKFTGWDRGDWGRDEWKGGWEGHDSPRKQ